MKIWSKLLLASLALQLAPAGAQNFKSYAAGSRAKPRLATPAPTAGGAKSASGKSGAKQASDKPPHGNSAGLRVPAHHPESAYYKHVAPQDFVNAQKPAQPDSTANTQVKTQAAAPETKSYGSSYGKDRTHLGF